MNKSLGSILLVILLIISCCVISVVVLFFGFMNYSKSVLRTMNDARETSMTGLDTVQEEAVQEFGCLFTTDSKIEKYDDYIFDVVVSNQGRVEWGENWTDSGNRKISLNTYTDDDTNRSKLVMSMRRQGGSYIDKNLNYKIQICDSNNTTNIFGYVENKSIENIYDYPDDGESMQSYSEITRYELPTETGKYRVDALAYFNGEWRLVDRIEVIEFVK